jgi:hypothetical protein
MVEIDFSLNYHYVCFIDILGFSNMVKSDCETPKGGEQYIEKLYHVHNDLLVKDLVPGLNKIQFSDSVVLSAPFVNDKKQFEDFLVVVAKYQFSLFEENILTRGGIAHGKHFINDTFMFSYGLMEAYKLETISKYPRVLLSKDLVELIFPGKTFSSTSIIKQENDEEYFLDYFSLGKEDEIKHKIEEIISQNSPGEYSIKPKVRWLIDYYNFKFPQNPITPTSRFI